MARLKNDKYRSARGCYARLLRLRCRKCGKALFTYQKDGAGPLRRLYIDRMEPKRSAKELKCSCGAMIGTRYVYMKEKRPAYRLYVDALVKEPLKQGY
ncbi:MAG: hypothetical protein R6U32_03870 [Candidatus Woesearchaeota archaeon]